MTNKEKLISLIGADGNRELLDEIEYHMESGNDIDCAFDDTMTFAEENNERRLLKVCRSILIKAGYFIERPNKCETGRDTRFTQGGIRYDCATHWEGWINE